jgi:hypothetical protein
LRILLLAAAALIALAFGSWLRRPRAAVPREPWEPDDRVEPVDREALEAAEREVRHRREAPEEEAPGDDWGPGAGR